MTRTRYLEMCEQLGKEPVEEEIPPDYEDFPDIAIVAMNVFAALGDRIYPEVGFVGKDFTSLDLHFELNGITGNDRDIFLEILLYLESRAIDQSREEIKRAMDKLKRKSRGS